MHATQWMGASTAKIAAAIWPLLIMGCQVSRLHPLSGPHVKSTERDFASAAESVASQPAADASVLAKVQEFLERTQSFEQPAHTLAAQRPESHTLLGDTARSHRIPVETRQQSPPSQADAQSFSQRNADGPVLANGGLTIEGHKANANGTDSGPAVPVVESVVVVPIGAGTPEVSKNVFASVASNASLGPFVESQPPALAEILVDLESRVRRQEDRDAEWQLRLMQLALNRDAEAAELSPTLTADARTVLAALIASATAVRGVFRNSSMVADEVLDPLEKLRRTLMERADPVISAVALCQSVVTFGVYQEMDETEFIAGRPVQTIVYVEVDGFRSEQTEDGMYRTALGTRIELLDAGGTSFWEREEPEIVDLCRTTRRDFFLAQRITLPPTLPAGQYVLKVGVEDRLSGRRNERAIDLTIHDITSLAQTR